MNIENSDEKKNSPSGKLAKKTSYELSITFMSNFWDFDFQMLSLIEAFWQLFKRQKLKEKNKFSYYQEISKKTISKGKSYHNILF